MQNTSRILTGRGSRDLRLYIENLEAELNECKMLNNQLMSDLDADEGLAEICVNEFIADTIKAVKDAGVKKITVEF